MADYNENHIRIIRNVYRKLDNLPLGFGLQSYSDELTDDEVYKAFGMDLSDTLREIRIDISNIEPNSYNELQVENRTVYYALRRFRLSSAVFFKFSTAVDGKSVDKTQIPKMLSNIISEYDSDFKKWRSGSLSRTWNITIS